MEYIIACEYEEMTFASGHSLCPIQMLYD